MNDSEKIAKAYLEMLEEAKIEEEIPLIILIVEPDEFDGEQINFSESRWQQSFKNGWSYRIDPRNDGTSTKRHVHIARTKHISSKTNQVSWNDDGTRHDKKNFNSKLSRSRVAQKIARTALNLDDKIELFEEGLMNFSMFCEGLENNYEILTLTARLKNS